MCIVTSASVSKVVRGPDLVRMPSPTYNSFATDLPDLQKLKPRCVQLLRSRIPHWLIAGDLKMGLIPYSDDINTSFECRSLKPVSQTVSGASSDHF